MVRTKDRTVRSRTCRDAPNRFTRSRFHNDDGLRSSRKGQLPVGADGHGPDSRRIPLRSRRFVGCEVPDSSVPSSDAESGMPVGPKATSFTTHVGFEANNLGARGHVPDNQFACGACAIRHDLGAATRKCPGALRESAAPRTECEWPAITTRVPIPRPISARARGASGGGSSIATDSGQGQRQVAVSAFQGVDSIRGQDQALADRSPAGRSLVR